MNQRRAILWDLDGTLIDTKESHFITWKNTLHALGYELDEELFNKNFGRTNEVIVPIFLGFEPDPDHLVKLIEEKETAYLKIAPHQCKLVPGVETWLSTAAELKIKQAVASSGPINNVNLMLQSFRINHYFGAIVSGTNMPTKPEPDIFIKAAYELGCQPENCLVVEDSLAGVMGAKNAGMKCIAVTTSHKKEELELADYIVEDFNTPLFTAFSEVDWN